VALALRGKRLKRF